MENLRLECWIEEDNNPKDLEYWMILNDFENEIGKFNIRTILKEDINIVDIFNMSYKDLKSIFGEKSQYLWNDFKKIQNKINIDVYKNKKLELLNKGIKIIKYTDKSYPKLLKSSEKLPPLVLYQKGSLLEFENCVAIVGARDSSYYARKKARELAQCLAERGYTIVAGLALGIDTEAHCGALDVEGKTVAVIPNIEEITPRTNRRLADDIIKHGALLSPGSPFSKLSKDKWVKRNKIISGISMCVIVAESPKSRGTYHQVNFAIKQGVKVFVLEPRENDRLAYEGFRQFLEMGAIPFSSENDVIDYLKKLH